MISRLNNAIERYVAEYRPTRMLHQYHNNNSANNDKASVSGTTNSTHFGHISSRSSSASVSDGCSNSETSSQAGGSFHNRSTSLRHSAGIGGQESEDSTSIHGGTIANNKHGGTMIVSLYGPGGIGE